MSDSEEIKNYEKYITEINNRIDVLSREVINLYDKIDELIENNSFNESKLSCNDPITEEELLLNIDKGIFNPRLEGMEVILKEGEDNVHNWIIIRVNSDSYDLWYNDNIGIAEWKGSDNDRYWINNDPIDTKYVKGLCTSYRYKLSSSIRAKLKTGLNTNCGISDVVILSARQLGYTGSNYLNDDNSPILYFNSKFKRNIGSSYWTSSACSGTSYLLWFVGSGGAFNNEYCDYSFGVVPAIRVGK